MVDETMQQKYADKIAKLLAKAESTTSEEAELLIAKAQELMMQYSIEQTMIDKARGVEREEIEQRHIYFTGNYRTELLDLAWRIAVTNNCKGVQWKDMLRDDPDARKAVKVYQNYDGTYSSKVTTERKTHRLTLTGFYSDLERVVMLEMSLRIQALSAVTSWWAEEKKEYDWMPYNKKVRARSEFLEGFISGVDSKLRDAARVGRASAVMSEAARTGTTEDESSDSVALVLRSRKDQVQDWYDKKYGKSLKSSRASYKKSVSFTAHGAGHTAGRNANLGNPSAGAGQRSLA